MNSARLNAKMGKNEQSQVQRLAVVCSDAQICAEEHCLTVIVNYYH